jgi:hypothetical protein
MNNMHGYELNSFSQSATCDEAGGEGGVHEGFLSTHTLEEVEKLTL